jgi:hypothetical protein
MFLSEKEQILAKEKLSVAKEKPAGLRLAGFDTLVRGEQSSASSSLYPPDRRRSTAFTIFYRQIEEDGAIKQAYSSF